MIEHPTHMALLGLIAWTVFLLIVLVIYRSRMVFTSSKAANSFSPSGEDLPALGLRLTRAYANCVELIPLFVCLLLYVIATEQTNVTDGLALYLLGARIAHSSTHIISTDQNAVSVRSIFFWAQIIISLYWLSKIVGQVEMY